MVEGVEPGSAASDADLQFNDEITSFDGQTVHSFDELTVLIGEKQPGDRITMEIHRAGETEPLIKEITLGQWK